MLFYYASRVLRPSLPSLIYLDNVRKFACTTVLDFFSPISIVFVAISLPSKLRNLFNTQKICSKDYLEKGLLTRFNVIKSYRIYGILQWISYQLLHKIMKL